MSRKSRRGVEMKIKKLMTKKELKEALEYFVREHDKLVNIIYDLHHQLNNNDKIGR